MVQLVVQMLVDLPGSTVLDEETAKYTETAHPEDLARHTCVLGTLPLTEAGVATGPLSVGQDSGARARVHGCGLLDDETVPNELADSLTGVGITDFAHFIRQHGRESNDPELILKLKSILWAVGNVGATDGGLPFLEEEEIIPVILDIAEQSPIPSVRGTCFYVLGLISSTSQGAEILDDYQWEATLSPLGTPTGLCMPVDVEKFMSMPSWKPPPMPDDSGSRLLPPTTQTELEVITAIQNLGNTVIANAASRSLTKMKSRPEYRPVFSSTSTFYRALNTISTQRFRLPVRRYILDLFNIELDSEVVRSLSECAKTLRAPPSYKQSKSPSSRVVSMFGRLGRPRRTSESDDEASDTAENDNVIIEEKPVITLRPVSRIIGFDK